MQFKINNSEALRSEYNETMRRKKVQQDSSESIMKENKMFFKVHIIARMKKCSSAMFIRLFSSALIYRWNSLRFDFLYQNCIYSRNRERSSTKK